jgi:predicted component of type VI protein secretion system
MIKGKAKQEQLCLRESLSKLETALVRLDTAREIIRGVVTNDVERAVLFASPDESQPKQVH